MTVNRLSLLASILAVVVGVAAFAGGAPVSRAGTKPRPAKRPRASRAPRRVRSERRADPCAERRADCRAVCGHGSGPHAGTHGQPRAHAGAHGQPRAHPSDPSPTASPTPTPVPRSDTLRLKRLAVIRGSISPKSVVATQTGLVFAQNMMYRHTMTVYNRRGQLVKTIPDRVILSRYGFPAYPLAVRGAPVEAAVAPDGRHMYVSQYSMYGPGFAHPGGTRAGSTTSSIARSSTRSAPPPCGSPASSASGRFPRRWA